MPQVLAEPASNIVAETCVLGAMILAPASAAACMSMLRAEDFYRPAHQELFRLLIGELEAGRPLDLVLLKSALVKAGKLEAVGGMQYVLELVNVPDCANVRYYAGLVVDASRLRSLAREGSGLYHGAMSPQADAGKVAEDSQQRIFELSRLPMDDPLSSAGEVANAAMFRTAEGQPIQTGMFLIDRDTGGMYPGELWTLGAATSAGKTALAHTIALQAATTAPVLIVSAEMDKRAVGVRLLAAIAKIDGRKIRAGHLTDQERENASAAAKTVAGLSLWVYDRCATVGQIGSALRACSAAGRGKIKLLIVDYLQLMQPTAGDTRAQQVGLIAWGLKQIAVQEDCAVLLVSQLSREGVKQQRGGQKRGGPNLPALYDLKESGDVENHSSVVLLLHRPLDGVPDDTGAVEVWCRIAKNRNGMTTPWPDRQGQTGGIRLLFRTRETWFDSYDSMPKAN